MKTETIKLCPEGMRRTKTEPCLCGNGRDYDLNTSIGENGRHEIYVMCGSCGYDPSKSPGERYVSKADHPELGIDLAEVHYATLYWNRGIKMEREGIKLGDISDTMPPTHSEYNI